MRLHANSASPFSPDDLASGLLIPYAQAADGTPVSPREAQRGQRLTCPVCGQPVLVRKGEIVRHHFAHAQTPGDCAFAGEGARHLLAKHALLFAVYQWKKRGGPAPCIERRCAVCGATRLQPLPRRVRRARLEHRIPNGSAGGGLVLDLALLDASGELVAAAEVRDSHGIEPEKARRLGALPWVEVDATDAIEDPTLWRALDQGNLRAWKCDCAQGRPLAVTMRGRASHVDRCPLAPRTRAGRTFANVALDCADCPHCIGVERESGGGRPIRVVCRKARTQSP